MSASFKINKRTELKKVVGKNDILCLIECETGEQGQMWRRGFARSDLEYFQVVFEGIASEGKRDNIAIDDIMIADCSLFGTQFSGFFLGGEGFSLCCWTRMNSRFRTATEANKIVVALTSFPKADRNGS